MEPAYLIAHLLQKHNCLTLYEEFSQLIYLAVELRVIHCLLAYVVTEVEVFLGMVFVDLQLLLKGLRVEEGQADEGLDCKRFEGGLEVLELHENGQ